MCRLADDIVGRGFGHTVFYQFLYHQLLHAVIDIGVCQITTELFRECIVPLSSYLRHHRLAPFLSHHGKVTLHILVADNSLLAHRQIVFGGLAVPLACNLQRGVWVITRHIGSGQ